MTATDSRRALVVIGDSLTEHGTWPEMVSRETGWALQREGRAGQTSTEIALRAGARILRLEVPDAHAVGEIAVIPDLGSGDVREFVEEGMADIEVSGELDGRRGMLTHRVSAAAREGWTFSPLDDWPLDDEPLDDGRGPGRAALFRPDPLRMRPDAVVILWCGRNNPGPAVIDDVDAVLRCLAPRGGARSALVLGVHAAAFEPAGSTGAAVVGVLNERLARVHGNAFVDVQSALLAAAPREDEVADVSLRADDVHLGPAGDAVVAAAIRARLIENGWWMPAGAA